MSTIRCPLFETAEISRHELALVSEERALRYHELDELASRVACHAEALGVAPGEHVALYLPVDWSTVAVFFGLLRAGVVACLIPTRLPRAGVLDHLRRAGCSRVIARLKDPAAPDLAGLVIHDPALLLAPLERAPAAREWRVDLARPAVLLFTSGSAGEPKAVVLSHGNLYYSARGANLNIHLASRDRWLLTLPLHHVGGLGVLYRCILVGAAVALADSGEDIALAQERFEATHLSVVATQLIRLLRRPALPASFARVKSILLGGGPTPASVLADALRRGWPVYSSYGLSEMASQVCTADPRHPAVRRMNAGAPLRYRQVRISAAGEIEVRGETLFMGYWSDGAVREARNAEGWFATGDLGAWDEHGQLQVCGRIDNLFISGGENIQPEEIERALEALPGVEAAVVVPVADAEFGERPAAFVRCGEGEPDAGALAAGLGERLPRYKIPVRFFAWPEAAFLPNGKPDRVALAIEARLRLS